VGASEARVATEAPVTSEDPQVGTTVPSKSEVEPVWQALLDVSVWRSRPWWWPLAASLVVKRLNR
jgi:hypothetical protein